MTIPLNKKSLFSWDPKLLSNFRKESAAFNTWSMIHDFRPVHHSTTAVQTACRAHSKAPFIQRHTQPAVSDPCLQTHYLYNTGSMLNVISGLSITPCVNYSSSDGLSGTFSSPLYPEAYPTSSLRPLPTL